MRSFHIAALAVVTACRLANEHYTVGDAGVGGDASDAALTSPDPRSGTRLKLVSVVYSGGARQVVGVHDAVLDVDCYDQQAWADGNTYCTPLALDVVYGDAQCAAKLAMVTPDTCAPTATPPIYARTLDARGRVAHLYRVGVAVSAPAQYFVPDGSGGCSALTTSGQQFSTVAAEILPGQLASITDVTPTAGAVVERIAESADGLVKPTGALHDNVYNFDCYLGYAPGQATTRCLPLRFFPALYYTDAQCTVPELVYPSVLNIGTPDLTVVPARTPAGQCPAVPMYSRVGAQNTPTAWYQYNSTTGACVAVAPPTNSMTYSVGAQVPLTSFARSPDAVAGRRISYMDLTAGPQTLHDAGFYDTALATECQPQRQPDGAYRCVPLGGSVRSYYSDAACQQAIDVAWFYQGAASCPPPVISAYASKAAGCTTEFHPVTTPYTGPLYFPFGAACMAADTSNYVVYRIGNAVPLVSFAVASPQIDP
jgi:hypothetical protein